MQTNEKRYKRFLVVNDDDTKEEFVSKYKGMSVWEKDMIYCQSINEALAYLESENRFCCDKILLDIKISWNAEERYRKEVAKLVDVDRMEAEYGGFILFMYLLAKGFPIDRIAFLSAYITEEDSERAEKEQVQEFLRNQKFRKEKTDEELRRRIERIPSLKAEMLRILENPEYGARDLTPYQDMRRLLEKDLEQIKTANVHEERLDEIQSAKAFFSKIQDTGLIVENKINKGNTGKLFSWLQEKGEELEGYYAFRTAACNLCDRLIAFYAGLEEEKNRIQDKISRMEVTQTEISQEVWERQLVLYNSKQKELNRMKEMGIYHYARKDMLPVFLEKYPPQYFADILSTIINMLDLNRKEKEINEVSNHVVNSLISYWEGLEPENYQSSKNVTRINDFSACVVLKIIRNWKMHNLIKDVDFRFMYFVFALSVRLLGYGNAEIQDFVLSELPAVKLPGIDKGMYSGINAKDLFVEMNRGMNKDQKGAVFVLNLYKLYSEFGRDPLKKSSNLIADIYRLFYLCLHFPYIEGDEVKLVQDNCEEKDELSKRLEQLAQYYIYERK